MFQSAVFAQTIRIFQAQVAHVSASKSKTLFVCCACFLCAVGAVSLLEWTTAADMALLFLFFSGAAVIIGWRVPSLRLLFLCAVCSIFGVWRYSVATPPSLAFPSSAQTITAYVAAEPDVRTDGVRYIVKLRDWPGNIYLRADLYPRYHYGDVLRVTCRFREPEPVEDFRYDMYLARFGVFTICDQPRIVVAGAGEGWWLYRATFSLKERVAERINRLWHEPYASFMAGLLYGYRGGLGNLEEAFARTGTTHIVAISGYNIAIVVKVLQSIFVKGLSIRRQRAFWFLVVGVSVFVIFAGMSASVVRAGIMGILVLISQQLGRVSQTKNILMLTATLMTLHNPYVLVWDAGFQLSFLATVGLIFFVPMLEKWFVRMPEAFGLRESFLSSLAATIITLPLIMHQFGRVSLVALIVNVLILWIIPWCMMAGAAAVVASAVWMLLGRIVAWAGFFGLWYVTSVVSAFASLPFAVVDLSVSGLGMAGMYGLLFLLYKKLTPTPRPV